MAGEWKEILFCDCAARVRDVVQPNTLTSTTPYIGLEHIAEGALHLNGQSEASLASSAKTRFQYGDILFGKLRPYLRKVARPKFDGICSTDIWAVRAKKGVDQGFLFYRMASEEFIEKSIGASTGTRMPRADWDFLSKWLMPLPHLPEQKAIAHILGTLDDKIDLNRRMNATLEAMVRALFQSWFVDFDPVRAKLDDRPPTGFDTVTADLFPQHLEESLLGKVPQGWRVLKFADILTPHSSRVGDEIVPEYSATMTGLIPRDARFKKQLSKSQSKNKKIIAGDLVFGFSREVINFGLMRDREGAVSPVYEVFKIDSGIIEPELLERLFRFNMPYFMDILKPGAREGKPIDRNYLLRKHLLVPDIAVQRCFLATIKPWTEKIKANDGESRTLATLRDTLLPKLLSGELSVADKSFGA